MSENYDLVYQWRRKCEIYRETGVSKNQYYVTTVLVLRNQHYNYGGKLVKVWVGLY